MKYQHNEENKMSKVSFAVNQLSTNSLIVVSADITSRVVDERSLQSAISKALETWIDETDVGYDAWTASGQLFNLKHLHHFWHAPHDPTSLEKYFEAEGIENFNIETQPKSEISKTWADETVIANSCFVPLNQIVGKTIKFIKLTRVDGEFGSEPCINLHFTDGTRHGFVVSEDGLPDDIDANYGNA